jgi:5'-deoxynucleotidase YfbR-like HD superfamily hydrolase
MNSKKSESSDQTESSKVPPGCIETYRGAFINPLDPDPDLISIEDIAHALAHKCRFNGHCGKFYSIAEHSVYVANVVGYGEGPEKIILQHQLAALIHDAAEAYLPDVATPLKHKFFIYDKSTDRLASFLSAELGLLEVITDALKIPGETIISSAVQRADELMLAIEAEVLMCSAGIGWNVVKIPEGMHGNLKCLEPQEAITEFLSKYFYLKQELSRYDGSAS